MTTMPGLMPLSNEELVELIPVLRACDQAESFRGAAKLLEKGKDAASSVVKKAELTLEFPLVDSTASGSRLTNHGQRLLEAADGLDAVMNGARRVLVEMQGECDVHLALSFTAAEHLLTAPLLEFQSTFPEMDLNVTTTPGNSAMTMQRLRANEAHGGIAILSPASKEEMQGLEAIPFCRDELVLVVGAEHKLFNRKTVRLADAAKDKRLVTRDRLANAHLVLQRVASEQGVLLEPMTRFGDTRSALEAARSRGCAAVVSSVAAAREPDGDLGVVRFADVDLSRDYSVLLSTAPKLHANAETFLRFIAERTDLLPPGATPPL